MKLFEHSPNSVPEFLHVMDRLDRKATISIKRPWDDLPTKVAICQLMIFCFSSLKFLVGDNFQIIQHFPEEEIGEPVEKRIGATYGD